MPLGLTSYNPRSTVRIFQLTIPISFKCNSALLRKPLTVVRPSIRSFVRSFARTVGLSSIDRSIYLWTHGVTQKCGLFCARRFEVARNSHPRNANYVRPYERIYARVASRITLPATKIKRKLAHHRLYLRTFYYWSFKRNSKAKVEICCQTGRFVTPVSLHKKTR